MGSRPFTTEEIKDLQEAFHEFSVDGGLDLKQLQQALRKLGQNATVAELEEIIHVLDIQWDDRIDFEGFLVLMGSLVPERDPERCCGMDVFGSSIEAACGHQHGDYRMDREEIKRVMKRLGQALSEEELDAMMEEADDMISIRCAEENRNSLLPLVKLRQLLHFNRAETLPAVTPFLYEQIFGNVSEELFRRVLSFLKWTKGDEPSITVGDFKELLES